MKLPEQDLKNIESSKLHTMHILTFLSGLPNCATHRISAGNCRFANNTTFEVEVVRQPTKPEFRCDLELLQLALIACNKTSLAVWTG